jgi:hypothetical protein
VSFSLLDARDGLSEGFLASFTPEASFSNEENGAMAADGIIFDTDGSMIVGRVGGCGAFWAVFGVGYFLAIIAGAEVVFPEHRDEFEFGKENKL